MKPLFHDWKYYHCDITSLLTVEWINMLYVCCYRYLVDCNPDVRSPVYLQRSDTYDLSSVAHPDFKKKVKPFHCLDTKAWPTMEELGLDESQFKAFHLALTKELAIIQGPPGTGKW